MEIPEKQKLYVLFAIFGFAGFMLYYNFLLKPQFAGFNAKNKEYRVVSGREGYVGRSIHDTVRFGLGPPGHI